MERKTMNNLTAEEIEQQHKMSMELYEKVRDAVGEYTSKLLPIHIYGVLGSITEVYSHWNTNRAIQEMKEDKDDGFAA